MDKVIYLHIGTTKTGTSSIQSFLYLNREVLAKKGYSYKRDPVPYDRSLKNRNAMYLNVRKLRWFGKPSARQQKRLIAAGLKRVSDQLEHCHAVILTDEGLWNYFLRTDCRTLKIIKNFADRNHAVLKLVVYFRPQEDWLESSYKQNIKKYREGKDCSDWETYISDPDKWPSADYYSGLCRMSEIVGKENMIVRIYDRKRFIGGKVENDFLQAIGLEPSDEYKIGEEEKNTSLNANYIEIKRILNKLDGIGNITEKELFHAQSAATDCSASLSRSGSEVFINPEQKSMLRNRYKEGNQKVLSEYVHEGDHLFPEPKEKPVWTKDDPHLFEDTVLMLGYMILNHEKEISRLKQTVYLRLKLYDKCRTFMTRAIQAIIGSNE